MKICRTCKQAKSENEFYFAHKRDNLLKLDCKECEIKSKKMYDWRTNSEGWPYKGDVKDPKYIADRRKLFNKSGNGWWWYAGVSFRGNRDKFTTNEKQEGVDMR